MIFDDLVAPSTSEAIDPNPCTDAFAMTSDERGTAEEEKSQAFVTAGKTYRVQLPYSEICMHMQVAGKWMGAQLVGEEHPMVQLYKADGTKFSFPILPGEAGLFYDGGAGGYSILKQHLVSE